MGMKNWRRKGKGEHVKEGGEGHYYADELLLSVPWTALLLLAKACSVSALVWNSLSHYCRSA